MGGGQAMILVLIVWLISIRVIVTFGNPDYHDQARRTLAKDNPAGSIPPVVMEKVADGSLHLSWDKNPNLCPTDSCKEVKKNKIVIPVVASICSALFLVLVSAMVFWFCVRGERGESNIEERSLIKSNDQEFTYSEIVSITDNFKTIIGKGGFGIVYLGTLKNGYPVAVKLHSPSSSQGPKEFLTEAQLLRRQVRHENLISPIGYCKEDNHMALIYEYMPRGNLRQLLSETNTDVLNWQKRLQIAIYAARGLDYLHNHCRPPIIHRDMKTSNILLNEILEAKISDFGLSRNFRKEGDTHVSTNPAGTPAYIDPEYWDTGKLNKKSDVYSFGIVLLEIITGHGAVIGGGGYINIIEWVRPILERGLIEIIVDEKLRKDINEDSARRVLEIAMSCVASTSIQRPDMSLVLADLTKCLAIEIGSEVDQIGSMVSFNQPDLIVSLNQLDLDSQIASLAR